MRLAASAAIDRVFRRIRTGVRSRRISRTGILWLLALTPVLIGPPLIALGLVAVAVRRDRDAIASAEAVNLALIVIVALANLGVSAWIDVHLAEDAVRLVIAIKQAFSDWLKDVLTLRVAPSGGFPHAPHGGGRSA